MYEPITMQIDRGSGEGTYSSYTISFTGRLVKTIQAGSITMRLYEWADYYGYLVYVEEDKPGRLPRRTLYPFINTHSAKARPTKGYTAEEVSRAYPEFANVTFLGLTRSSPRR